MLRHLVRIPHGVKTVFYKPTTSSRWMAGHSKWANIKHIKAQKDGMKSAIFTKISRQIRLAVQEGGSANPALNTQLRSVIDNGLRNNMPMSTIQNAIKKSQNSKNVKKCRMDIRFKKNIYMICILYTDNFSGVKMDATGMIKKAGGIFVDVGHMFDDCGLVEARYDCSKLSNGQSLEEKCTEDAIECGAEDVDIVDSQDGTVNFICSPTHVSGVSKALEKSGYLIDSCEHIFTPLSMVQLSAEDQMVYDKFVQKLRDIPGLEDIYDNIE